MNEQDIEKAAREYADSIVAFERDPAQDFIAGARSMLPKVTTEPPTEPGAYWYSWHAGGKWALVDVKRHDDNRLWWIASYGALPLADLPPGTLWSRIYEPEDKP